MSAILQSALDDLHAKVANDAYLLYEALAAFADGHTNGYAPTAIKQCIDYVEHIEHVATQANLTGLRRICELTCQRLRELQTDEDHQQQLCEVIERWPRLVSNYLYAPTNETAQQKLITLLQDQVWAVPLAEEQINYLNTLLAQDFNATEEASNQTLPEEIFFTTDIQDLTDVTVTATDEHELITLSPETELLADENADIDETAFIADELPDVTETELLADENADIDETAFIADESPDVTEAELLANENADIDETAFIADESPDLTETELLADENADIDETAFIADELPDITEAELLADENADVDETAFIADESPDVTETELLADENADIDETTFIADESPDITETELLADENADIDETAFIADESPDETETELLADENADIDETAFIADELPDVTEAELLANENADIDETAFIADESPDVTEAELLANENADIDETAFIADELPDETEAELLANENADIDETAFIADELPDETEAELLADENTDIDETAFIADESPDETEAELLANENADIDETAFIADESPDLTETELLADENADIDETAFIADELPDETETELLADENADIDETAFIADELPDETETELLADENADIDETAFIADELPDETETELLADENADIDETAFIADELPDETETELLADENADIDETAFIADESPDVTEDENVLFSDEPVLSEEDIACEIMTRADVDIVEDTDDESVDDTELPVFDEMSLAAEETALRDATDDFIDDDLPNIESLAETVSVPSVFVETTESEYMSDNVAKADMDMLISDDMDDTDFTDVLPVTHDTTIKTSAQPASVPTISSPAIPEFSRSSKLETAANEIVAVTDILSETLHNFVTAEDDSDAFLEAIEGYTNTIQSLWEKAEVDGLSGLQEVYTFINDNIFELSTHPQTERLASYEHLSHWTEFVLEYLRNPQQGGPLLLTYLQDNQWLSPMGKNTAKTLLGKLTREGFVPAIETSYAKRSVNKPIPVTTVVSTKPVVNEPSQPATPPVEKEKLLLLDEKIVKPVAPVVETVIVQPLQLSIPEEESPSLDIEIDKPDWGGAFIDDDVLLASEVDDNEVDLTNSTEFDTVDALPLMDEENSEENSFADAEILDTSETDISLNEQDEISTLTAEESASSSVGNDTLDTLIAEIEAIQEESNKAITNLATADEESSALFEAIEAFTNHIQAIYDVAGLAELEGLQTVCDVMMSHVMELGEQSQTARMASKPVLETYVPHVLAYLQNPLQNAPTLIEYLQNPIWTTPLDAMQADTLLLQLTHGALEVENNEQAEQTDLNDFVDDTPESITVVEDISPIEEFTEEPVDIVEDNSITGDTDISLMSADMLDLLITQLAETDLLLTNGYAEVMQAEDSSEELLNAISDYSESVQNIWDITEQAQLTGLQEVCTFVNDNIMALSSQDNANRLIAKPLFTDWVTLAIEYLQYPSSGASTLVNFLQQKEWAYPLDSERADELYTRLLAPAVQTEQLETEQVEPELTESSELIESIESIESIDDINDINDIEEASPVLPKMDIDASEEETELLIQTEQDENETLAATIPSLVIADPEIIDLLIGQFTDTADALLEPLQSLTMADDGSEELLTAVENYTEQVQALWDAADMAKLHGLQEVCTFINDNVMGLSAQALNERQAAMDVFSQWIPHSIDYLQDPANQANRLTNYLQQSTWVNPLSDEQAAELLEKLVQSATSAESIDAPAVAEIPEELSEIYLADPDILMLLIGQLHDAKEQLIDITQAITNAEDGSEELLMAVGSYTENVQSVWDAAEMAQLHGMQEICTFVNDNVMQLGMAEQATRLSAQPVLTDWLDTSIAYLENPRVGVESLLEILQNSAWAQPLEEERVTALRQQLLPTSSVTPTNTIPLVIASPDIIELLQNQIQDVIAGLSTALEECVSMENDNPALLEAIENYTNQVQAIWDAAEMAGLQGLQEVCTFVNDNLMAFGTQEPAEKLAVKPYIEQWPIVVLEYLHNPLDGAQKLITLLQAPVWSMPLDDERAIELHQLLTQPSTAADQVSAYQEEFADTTLPEEESEEEESAEELAELEVAEGEGGEISLGNAEVLEILQSELESAKEELTDNLAKYTSLANDAEGFNESAENYADQVMRLYAAAEMMGLEGLQEVSMFIAENVKALAEKDLAARQKAKKLLETWSDLVLSYLQSPADNVVKLVNHFREPQWATPLDDQQAYMLLQKLMKGSTVEESAEEAAAYNRQTTASPEDVLITPPEDINRDLYDAYLQEVPQNASDFTQCIQHIIQEPTIPEIERAQRIAHTLKGSSNIIGIKGIANIAHHLEDILEYLAQNQVSPPKALTDTMTEAADCLEIMVDSLTGQDDPPPQALQVLQDVLDWANKIDKGNLDAPSAPRKAVQAAPATEAGEGGEKTEPKKAAGGAPVEQGSPEQVLRVPTSTVDNLMRLVGELSISIGQIHERLRHVLGNTRLLTDQGMVLQRKTFELENIVDIRGITGVESRYNKMAQDEEEFDPLEFEEYNELHSVAHSFIESIADARELGMSIRNDLSELETMLVQHERLNKEFQANIMTTRMVPVSTVISKLQRNVRQTCRMTGKQAELEVIGTDIMIDSDVLNNLADPLMHILRNSIDHGIEPVEDRKLLGKPESGTILLRFYREGNSIVMSCKDDGQGLNYTNIRYTAIQRGLITEAQEIAEPELARLILMSGFSTKSGVTQVSGRGVGMDVVYTNVRQMKGTLDLVSETGKGTNIVIKLPMSLVTVHVLVIRMGQNRYGIPTNALEQALAPESGEFHQIGNEITFKMGKKVFALKSMASLLNVQGDGIAANEYHTKPILLVHEETGVTAVIVDELLDTHDLVMKSMGKYVVKVRGVSGAAILGDGSLVPLLDVPELLRSPMQMALSNYMGQQEAADTGAVASVPKVLIVDDSLSVRKSLSTLVEDAGFEVLLAKDGVEAIEVMNQTRPNVMLVDMEMPRMNGLELTAHVRANPATQKLPIFMITSRTTEKHREQARTAGVSAYLTKPYQDTELLDWIDKGLAGQV
ncbi:response regulator [Beggiatoa leptomitoformis]|uniref:Chemotaxis protein CheA n=1 Tax=Beggiatoa leptomitoformis TaxID=288004 RepID=A0A2N9YGR9_9GAMM|nr:response regulator [Beggiatoa leptomitoformis]ALG67994.1 response regulator [Beggiatoa leptomitoformis]AUI69722.1 response regulator [Beggiatoa leptomitoformis]